MYNHTPGCIAKFLSSMAILASFILLPFCLSGCDNTQLTKTPDNPAAPAAQTTNPTKAPLRTQVPLAGQPTNTATATTDLDRLPTTTTPAITPSSEPKTATDEILLGELAYSPDDSCQAVPNPVLLNQDNLSGDIRLAGSFFLCRNWPEGHPKTIFDLDTGKVGQGEDAEGDIEFSIHSADIDNNIFYSIRAINEAQIFEVTSTAPTLRDCLWEISDDYGYIVDASVGKYACIKTNHQRVALIRIEQWDPFGWGSIEISFTTWNE